MIESGGGISKFIDNTGDGLGNTLSVPVSVAVDTLGRIYVAGFFSNNVFRVETDGTVVEIIDANGDDPVGGLGNPLTRPWGVAVDALGNNVYVAGYDSDNAFHIDVVGGTITQIIDSTGDGGGNPLDGPRDIGVDTEGTVSITGSLSDNVFRIRGFGGLVTEIADDTGDGFGNGLYSPWGLVVDVLGNVHVTGVNSHNAFIIPSPITLPMLGPVALLLLSGALTSVAVCRLR
jgi:DNA-binding beta-propeller fold protein YncE